MMQRELKYIAGLTGLWLLALAWLQATGDFPLNDDWVYAQSVRSLMETGRFQLADWSQALGFPQAYWGYAFAQVLGFSFLTLRVSMWVLGLAGVIGTYLLLREARVGAQLAFIGAGCCTFNPLYFSLSNTFMTDVPFYVLSVLSLWAWIRWLNTAGKLWLTASLIACYLAILTRQFGLALLLSYAASLVLRRDFKFQRWLAAGVMVVVGLGLMFGLQYWLQLQGRHASSDFSIVTVISNFKSTLLGRIPKYIVLSTAFLAPFVILVAWIGLKDTDASQRRATCLRWGITSLVVAVIFKIRHLSVPGWGNVLEKWGIGPMPQRDTMLLNTNLPAASPLLQGVWAIITFFGIFTVSFYVISLLDARDKGRQECKPELRDPPENAIVQHAGDQNASNLILLASITFAGFVCFLPTTFFDRYILFSLPLALLLLIPVLRRALPQPRASQFACSVALLTAMLCASMALTSDWMNWNSAKWAALNDLQKQGIMPSQVDGGYEYNGWFLYKSGGQRLGAAKSWWWVEDDLYIVTFGQLPGHVLFATYPYKQILGSDGRIQTLKRSPAPHN